MIGMIGMNIRTRTFSRILGLVLIAGISTAASCAPVTLRQAQDSFNTGIEGMSSLPRGRAFGDNLTPADVLKLPETHFRRTLDLIQKGDLVSDSSQPAHLRYAALLLQSYSHYSLYRLSPAGDPEEETHRKEAATIVDKSAGPAPFEKLYAEIPPEKKPIVRRENALFLVLHLLVRAEDHLRRFERDSKNRADMGKVFQLYQKLLADGVGLLGTTTADSTSEIYVASPVAEYVVLVLCDLAQVAFTALEASDIPPASPAQKTAANGIGGQVDAAAAWILRKGRPVPLASLKDSHPRLYQRCQTLLGIANGLFGGTVTDLPH
jgi:hypothetical protein